MKYRLLYDIKGSINYVDYKTFEEAKNILIQTFITWIKTEQNKWKFSSNGFPLLTKKQIKNWNDLIFFYGIYIDIINDEGIVIRIYYPTDEELEKIGWMKWDELKEKYN